jgi:hypothetical protein
MSRTARRTGGHHTHRTGKEPTMRRLFRLATVAATALALTAPGLVSAADHLDGPAVSANGAIDINDLYVFEGADAANTVLTMTVNPAAGNISGTDFDPAAEYRFLVDTNADAAADITYTVTFEAVADGTQAYTVSKAGTPVATGVTNSNVSIDTGGMAFAGLVDDPFFFDLEGFQQLKQTLLDGGTLEDAISLICDTDPDVNFFAGFDSSAIVLEVPDAELGGAISVWAETVVDGAQIDRMGKPGINTVFITGDAEKDGYNAADPANDAAEYTDEVVGITSAIQQALGVAEADANAYGEAVAGMLLPDVLPYDTSAAADFSSFNGRGLADDVIDVYYQVLTTVDEEPALMGDCVANDSEFRAEFPYLAAANAAGGGGQPSASPAPSGSPATMPDTGIGQPSTGDGTTLTIVLAVLAIAGAAGVSGMALARIRR